MVDPQVTFKDVESSDALDTRIRDRVERLQRFHRHIVACRVVVDVPHRTPGSAKRPLGIAVEVDIPGRSVVAKAQEEQHEHKGDRVAFIGRAFDAMERQLEDASQVDRLEVKGHAGGVETARVARLFAAQRYGFLELGGGPELHFNEAALDGLAFEELSIGREVAVTRAVGDGPMGPRASSVRRLGAEVRMPGSR